MAVRCGYVAIDKGSIFYGRNFREIDEDIDWCVHGGITFADWLREVIDKPKFQDLWGYGIDFMHFGDKYALDDAIRYGLIENGDVNFLFKNKINEATNGFSHLWTVDEVEQELKKLTKVLRNEEENYRK